MSKNWLCLLPQNGSNQKAGMEPHALPCKHLGADSRVLGSWAAALCAALLLEGAMSTLNRHAVIPGQRSARWWFGLCWRARCFGRCFVSELPWLSRQGDCKVDRVVSFLRGLMFGFQGKPKGKHNIFWGHASETNLHARGI